MWERGRRKLFWRKGGSLTVVLAGARTVRVVLVFVGFVWLLIAHGHTLIGTDRADLSGHYGLKKILSFLIFRQSPTKQNKTTQNE